MPLPDAMTAALQRAAAREAETTAGNRIWLEPNCGEKCERSWADYDLGPCECGRPCIAYVRADEAERQLAEAAVDWDKLQCIFGCQHPVVGIYHLEGGCAVKPDQLQALCLQHKVSAESIGHMSTIVERLEP